MEAVYGLDIAPLLEGEIAIEAIVVCKVMTPDGQMAILIRHTDGLAQWDRIGMLIAAADVARVNCANCFRPDADD